MDFLLGCLGAVFWPSSSSVIRLFVELFKSVIEILGCSWGIISWVGVNVEKDLIFEQFARLAIRKKKKKAFCSSFASSSRHATK